MPQTLKKYYVVIFYNMGEASVGEASYKNERQLNNNRATTLFKCNPGMNFGVLILYKIIFLLRINDGNLQLGKK